MKGFEVDISALLTLEAAKFYVSQVLMHNYFICFSGREINNE